MNKDYLTETIRKSMNILFVSNPQGTSLGVLLGIILNLLLNIFSPIIKTIAWLSISSVKVWHLMAFGVFSFNAPKYFRRNEIDPSISKFISYIEEQKKNKTITEIQARQMYSKLHNSVLEGVVSKNKPIKINAKKTKASIFDNDLSEGT